MAIVYPLTLPTTKSFRRIRLYAINTVGVARSPYTHGTQVQEFAGQSWGADVQYPEMSRSEAEAFNAFLLSCMGQRGTFYLSDPTARLPNGTPTGDPRINGANQTGNTVITDGWTANSTNNLLAGDYIQIGTGLHKVLQNVSADAGGNATLEIWPRLAISPADNAIIVTSNARGIFRLTENVVTIFEADESKLFSVGFNAVEVKP